MAIYLNNNVGIKLATNAAPTTPSIDISDLVSSAVINQIVDELEITAMGDTAHRYVAGLQSGTFTIDFINDWAASAVNETLSAAFGKTLAVSVITVKGTAVGATNPIPVSSITFAYVSPLASISNARAASLGFRFSMYL